MESKNIEPLKNKIRQNIINLQKLLEQLEARPKVIDRMKATQDEFADLRRNLVEVGKVEVLQYSVMEYWVALITDRKNPHTHTTENIQETIKALDEAKDELSADLGIEI